MTEISQPWSIAALSGKYYGTKIVDATGNEICKIWLPEGGPSEREISAYGPCVDENERCDDFCDSHHETIQDLEIARVIAAAPDLLEAALTGMGYMQAIIGDVSKIAPSDPKVVEAIASLKRVEAAITKASGKKPPFIGDK